MVWKVQGNLPTLPQRDVGMFVPCQENSSFPVFFANCCLVVCCGKFRFCLLGHRRRLHRAGLWWTQRPMTSRAPELQMSFLLASKAFIQIPNMGQKYQCLYIKLFTDQTALFSREVHIFNPIPQQPYHDLMRSQKSYIKKIETTKTFTFHLNYSTPSSV